MGELARDTLLLELIKDKLAKDRAVEHKVNAHDETFNIIGKALQQIGEKLGTAMTEVQRGFQEVRTDLQEVRADLQEVRAEMRVELQRIDAKVDIVKQELTGHLNGVLVEMVRLVKRADEQRR